MNSTTSYPTRIIAWSRILGMTCLLGFLVHALTVAAEPEAPMADLSIVANGVSSYQIIVPNETTPVVDKAAAELQGFLQKISGVQLPIVSESGSGDGPAILIGRSDRAMAAVPESELAQLGKDGIRLKTAGSDLILLGADQRGQLYSVHELLQRLGVRFLAHDCTVIPKTSEVNIAPIDYAYTPPFFYRETSYHGSQHKDIAARQRLNGPTQNLDESVGGGIHFHPFVHSFHAIVPPDKYFESHPEFFCLIDGKRCGPGNTQLCLTNKEMHKVAIAQALKWLEENPHLSMVETSQREGGRFCECDDCLAVIEEEGGPEVPGDSRGSYAPILRFVNVLADAVAEKYPDKGVVTLGYNYMPPEKTKPRNNVYIRLTHAGCYFHGATNCRKKVDGRNDGGADLFLKSIDEWSKVSDNVWIWHYTTNFLHYLNLRRNLVGLPRDLKYYRDHGVNGVYVQGNRQSPAGELAELRQYLASQLLWNPDRDPMKIREEFVHGYYGPAGNQVLEFLALMDEPSRQSNSSDSASASATANGLPAHAWGSPNPKENVSPEFVDQALEILNRAKAQATTSKISNRIDKLFMPLWHAQIMYPEHYGLSKKEAADLLSKFEAVVQANGITHRSEGPQDMDGWIRTMKEKLET